MAIAFTGEVMINSVFSSSYADDFRAFLFGYLEELVKLHSSNEFNSRIAEAELARIHAVVMASIQELVNIGYSEIAIESFHDVSI